MYDLGGWLLGILKRERKTGETNVRLWENGYFAANLCDAFLCFVRDAGAYLYFILQIVQGSLPVSDFVWYISVVASCQQACSAFLENVELLGRLSFDYSRLRLFSLNTTRYLATRFACSIASGETGLLSAS